jgi:hypothetical protein
MMAALDGGALPLPLKGREIGVSLLTGRVTSVLLFLSGGKSSRASCDSSPFKGEGRRGMGCLFDVLVIGYWDLFDAWPACA